MRINVQILSDREWQAQAKHQGGIDNEPKENRYRGPKLRVSGNLERGAC
jgi:hypothetical protein